MAEKDEWSVSANNALTISLFDNTADGIKKTATFSPRFTYPIFGEDEHIFGYKDLNINLQYDATSMRPHIRISSRQKFKAVGDTEPADLKGILREHLPPVAFTGASDFETSIKDRGTKWSPPGALHCTFTSGDDTFEIWKTNLAAPGVRQLINRIEVLVPLFIEGGSYIARDLGADDTWAEPEDLARWAVFLLYRKQAVDEEVSRSPFLFAGYSTVYQFFPFQASSPPSSPRTDWDLPQGDFDLSELPCRSRLSQFIILPPYQGKGVGAQLYKSIFELYLQRPQTVELTIEDPNEAFDDMRDLSDLTYLRTVPEFSQVQVDTTIALPSDATSPVPRDIINPQLLETLKRKTKIAPRQFARLVEMHTMSQLPASVQPQLGVEKVPAASKSDKHKYHLWQVWVKKRVYKQNRDILGQIESGERLDKLNEALRSVELEYARLLAAHARWVKHYPTRSVSNNGKRKLADEAEDQSASKKLRVEEA